MNYFTDTARAERESLKTALIEGMIKAFPHTPPESWLSLATRCASSQCERTLFRDPPKNDKPLLHLVPGCLDKFEACEFVRVTGELYASLAKTEAMSISMADFIYFQKKAGEKDWVETVHGCDVRYTFRELVHLLTVLYGLLPHPERVQCSVRWTGRPTAHYLAGVTRSIRRTEDDLKKSCIADMPAFAFIADIDPFKVSFMGFGGGRWVFEAQFCLQPPNPNLMPPTPTPVASVPATTTEQAAAHPVSPLDAIYGPPPKYDGPPQSAAAAPTLAVREGGTSIDATGPLISAAKRLENMRKAREEPIIRAWKEAIDQRLKSDLMPYGTLVGVSKYPTDASTQRQISEHYRREYPPNDGEPYCIRITFGSSTSGTIHKYSVSDARRWDALSETSDHR